MSDILNQEIQEKMQKAVDSLKHQLSRLRTGRAHPSILDNLSVDYYGSMVPINQVANVLVENAQTLSISPWEKSMVQAIEKAILASDLGLNPATSGDVIRLPMPTLTEQRRHELIKVAKEEAEKARIAIRNIRRDANQDLKKRLKDKEISEDETRREEEIIQNSTDQLISIVDDVLAEKEKDLMII